MGSAGAGPSGNLVFFDLDGTITRRDTLVPYVRGFLAQRPGRAPRLAGTLPAAVGFLAGTTDRGALKGALLHSTLGGVPRAELDAWSDEYVPRVLAERVFADALEAIRRHRAAGDHLVLMSASVDLYVPRIGAALGFHETICSRVRWSGDVLDGRLDGPNCRDVEKARQLRQVLPRFPGVPVVAYGNSAPDLDHLRLATRGVLVNASPRLRAQASGMRVEFVDWR